MAALTSFDDLAALFIRDSTPHDCDRSRQVIELPVADPSLDGPLRLRWYRQAPMVEVTQGVVRGVPHARAADVARAVAQLNHTSDLPGLSYDEFEGRVYFRIVVPAFPPLGIEAEVLYQLAEAAARGAQAARPKIAAVIG